MAAQTALRTTGQLVLGLAADPPKASLPPGLGLAHCDNILHRGRNERGLLQEHET